MLDTPEHSETAYLRQRIADLEAELATYRCLLNPQDDGNYTYQAFMLHITQARHGVSYAACVDYTKATQNTPGATAVTHDQLIAWKKKDCFPAWAIEQITQLCFANRPPPTYQSWSAKNRQFLRHLVEVDHITNHAQLASLCSMQFNRVITIGAIKGMLYRCGYGSSRLHQKAQL